MKKLTLVAVLAFALIFSTFSVFADSDQSILSKVTGLSDAEITELRTQRIGYGQLIPASILAGRLGMDIKDVIALRQSGKSYYQIAVDKDINVEDYKNDLLDKRNTYIDEQVKAGTITADQGELIKERMSTNIENCDGQTPGAGRINGGCGFGRDMSGGFGRGFGRMGNGVGFRINAQ
ncbi:MAG: hypothetical protein APF77_09015 [Clostridia bacterium BRH_c25]|nr:MAG: hypothetical protein APF77_09015 [Clostridia bacterium BRH_c25]